VFALATTRLLESLLFGVKPADPITFGTMIVVLLVVAAIAGALPAARAVRVSVLEAIRSE
jgi:ABC-type antimicrobial peptide transport system permease subunit